MLMEHDAKPAESSPKVGDSFYREILEDGGGTGFVAASCSKTSACGDLMRGRIGYCSRRLGLPTASAGW